MPFQSSFFLGLCLGYFARIIETVLHSIRLTVEKNVSAVITVFVFLSVIVILCLVIHLYNLQYPAVNNNYRDDGQDGEEDMFSCSTEHSELEESGASESDDRIMGASRTEQQTNSREIDTASSEEESAPSSEREDMITFKLDNISNAIQAPIGNTLLSEVASACKETIGLCQDTKIIKVDNVNSIQTSYSPNLEAIVADAETSSANDKEAVVENQVASGARWSLEVNDCYLKQFEPVGPRLAVKENRRNIATEVLEPVTESFCMKRLCKQRQFSMKTVLNYPLRTAVFERAMRCVSSHPLKFEKTWKPEEDTKRKILDMNILTHCSPVSLEGLEGNYFPKLLAASTVVVINVLESYMNIEGLPVAISFMLYPHCYHITFEIAIENELYRMIRMSESWVQLEALFVVATTRQLHQLRRLMNINLRNVLILDVSVSHLWNSKMLGGCIFRVAEAVGADTELVIRLANSISSVNNTAATLRFADACGSLQISIIRSIVERFRALDYFQQHKMCMAMAAENKKDFGRIISSVYDLPGLSPGMQKKLERLISFCHRQAAVVGIHLERMISPSVARRIIEIRNPTERFLRSTLPNADFTDKAIASMKKLLSNTFEEGSHTASCLLCILPGHIAEFCVSKNIFDAILASAENLESDFLDMDLFLSAPGTTESALSAAQREKNLRCRGNYIGLCEREPAEPSYVQFYYYKSSGICRLHGPQLVKLINRMCSPNNLLIMKSVPDNDDRIHITINGIRHTVVLHGYFRICCSSENHTRLFQREARIFLKDTILDIVPTTAGHLRQQYGRYFYV